MSVLYISYDGASEPLGHSQVLPYLKGLAKKDYEITLLSFEKRKQLKDKSQFHKLKLELYKNKIQWIALKYHKSPPALSTLYDVLKGTIISWYLIINKRIGIIHARSYVPALIGLWLKKLSGTKFIFDMRGFWPEERIEGNLWRKDSLLYRLAKFFEKSFLLNADKVVILTEQSRKIIRAFPYLKKSNPAVVTIPTCVDLDKFKILSSEDENPMKLRDRLVFVYLGSIGTWYMLKEMVDFFKVVRSKMKNAYFLFLSPGEKSFIEAQMLQAKIPKDCFLIKEVPYDDVPKWLSYADFSIFFIRPSFSKKGSCPTKLAESLACGLPVIINSGIGDYDELVKKGNVGVVVSEFSLDSYVHAVDELQKLLKSKDLRNRCQRFAKEYYSLDGGIEKYQQIYRDLINRKDK